MKKLIVSLLVVSIVAFSSGCSTTAALKGGIVGAVTGGVAGVLLAPRNPIAGGLIGAMVGGALGAKIGEISAQKAREAAMTNRPVEYVSEDRRIVYLAEPVGYDRHSRCRKVKEKIWRDGKLMQTKIRTVCI